MIFIEKITTRMKYVKLFRSLDDFVKENSVTGDYDWKVNGRSGYACVKDGDIYCPDTKEFFIDNENVINVTYEGNSVTATTFTSLKSGDEYYAIKSSDVYQGNPENQYNLCTGDTGNLQYATWAERLTVTYSGGEGIYVGNWNMPIIPVTGGYICTHDETEDSIFSGKTFTTDKQITVIETGDGPASAYTFVCENSETVYGTFSSWDYEQYSGNPHNFSIMTGSSKDPEVFEYCGNIYLYEVEKIYDKFVRFEKPGVAYTKGTADVFYNFIPPKLYKIRATYYIEDTEEPTRILSSNEWSKFGGAGVYKAIVDGSEVIWDDVPDIKYEADEGYYTIGTIVMDSYYTFPTTGVHTIDFYYNLSDAISDLYYDNTIKESDIPLYMFCGVNTLTDIKFFDGITGFQDRVFGDYSAGGCQNLTGITIPKSFEYIYGNHVFSDVSEDCNFYYEGTPSDWAKINIGVGVGNSPWRGDGNRNVYMNGQLPVDVTIDGSVKNLGFNCFRYCDSITALTLNEGIETISGCCFTSCSNLKVVHLPSTLTGPFTFNYSAIEEIDIPEGITSLTHDISIGSTVGCFANCSSLTGVTLPSTLKEIGKFAFYQDSNLLEINLPNGLETIDNYAFCGCSKLSNVDFKNVSTIGLRAFSACTSIDTVIIPDSVTKLGDSSFRDASAITAITMGTGFTVYGSGSSDSYEGNNAFNSQNLKYLYIPSAATRFAWKYYSPFQYAKNTSAATIDSNGLLNCNTWSNDDYTPSKLLALRSITKLYLGEHIINIPDYALNKMTSITEIHFLGSSAPTITANSFSGIKKNGVVYVPTGASQNYSTFVSTLANGWTLQEE